jgi:hypothetical protein
MSFKKNKIKLLNKKRLKIITTYKKYLELHKYRTNNNLKNKIFLTQLLNNIGLFFNKTHNIKIICKQLNRQKLYEHKNLITVKNKFIHFRKFKNADFFKDGVNLMFSAVNQKGSAQMIGDFISYRIKRIKRHKYFISFLEKILTTFVKNKYSIISGIKIQITGRFNGAPRSKNKTILIKSMPLQSISSTIEHAQTTAYTKDGTFGIKVWVYDKK